MMGIGIDRKTEGCGVIRKQPSKIGMDSVANIKIIFYNQRIR